MSEETAPVRWASINGSGRVTSHGSGAAADIARRADITGQTHINLADAPEGFAPSDRAWQYADGVWTYAPE
jgi:hypothetical protein